MKKLSCAMCLLLLLCFSISGLANEGQPSDLSTLKRELDGFQEVIQNTLLRNLLGPLPVLSMLGTYLPDYGAVFNIEGNLYEIRAISPFSQAPRTQKELDDAYNTMLKRVESLRVQMLQAIADNGWKLEHLRPEETLAVVVHLFNGYDDPKRPCPSQMIFRVKKAAILEYRDKKVTYDDFVKKIEITRL